MTTQSTGWKSTFTAFLDRRALIMLFLGFSAGIPILLIFSSLSLWLGEAEKQPVPADVVESKNTEKNKAEVE